MTMRAALVVTRMAPKTLTERQAALASELLIAAKSLGERWAENHGTGDGSQMEPATVDALLREAGRKYLSIPLSCWRPAFAAYREAYANHRTPSVRGPAPQPEVHWSES